METTTEQEQITPEEKKGINIKFIIILVALVVAGGGYGAYKYMHSLEHEITDDAQIESKITPVIPKVSGYISKVLVEDNQYVKKGDTLIILDNSEYTLKLQQAEDALGQAQGQLAVANAGVNTAGAGIGVTEAGAIAANTTIETANANVKTVQANVEAAKVQVWRTANDFERYNKLYQNKSITKQQYEQALAAKETAEKQLRVVQEQLNVAKTQLASTAKQAAATSKQVDTSKAQAEASKAQITVANSAIKQQQTNIENAKLYLSYTYIIAAEDGQVSKVNLQAGQLVQAGQSLFNIVKTNGLWVVANYKETQLNEIREGQKAIIKVDAFPGHEFEATVTSISPATGAKFALLPPDNASGNFVKTVQRVPIKLVFSNPNDEMMKLLRPGMNVETDILLKSGTSK